MSLPDYLLENDERECETCGTLYRGGWRQCQMCQIDLADLYADTKIQDEKDGQT